MAVATGRRIETSVRAAMSTSLPAGGAVAQELLARGRLGAAGACPLLLRVEEALEEILALRHEQPDDYVLALRQQSFGIDITSVQPIIAERAMYLPGARLFDSEIAHQHYVVVTARRCVRKRDLKRDWTFATEVIFECSMSQAQWGAFVSSFGQGSGVPATLTYLHGVGRVPEAARQESRLLEVSLTPTPAFAGAQVSLVRSRDQRKASQRRSDELRAWKAYRESIRRG